MNSLSLQQRADYAASATDTDYINLACAASITSKPIDWLWKGWLARGKFHVLAGAPGTGKTTIALSLAAAISKGASLPDGSRAPAGNVLIWSGEDDPADTLKPRLVAAGADVNRVFFVGDVGIAEESRPFDPARDLAALEHAADGIGNVCLLIADPVVSAVSGDSHKNTEVRRALQPMVHLATRLDCAVLGISHFSKGTAGRDPVERVTGSIAFGALARVVLVAAKGEDHSRMLARAKSNIGADDGGFQYTLELAMSEEIEASVVRWGAPLEGSARELLGNYEPIADSPINDAAEWLRSMLEGAEVPVKNLKREASAAGLGWRTVERAKAELGVIAEPVGKSDGRRGVDHWCWRLAEKSAKQKVATLPTKLGGLQSGLVQHGFPSPESIKPASPHGEGINGMTPGDPPFSDPGGSSQNRPFPNSTIAR